MAPDQLAYTWYADGAAVGTSSTFTPAAAHVGKRITVQVTATKAGHSAVVTTSGPLGPVASGRAPALRLTAQKSTVRRGQVVRLEWTSTEATSLVASGAWKGVRAGAGAIRVRPSVVGTSSYVLSATNGYGTTTSRVQVRVTRPPARLKVTAAPVGARLRVTVRGLERGERFSIRIGTRKVATGTAKTARRLVRTVNRPQGGGTTTIRVTGDQPDRTGTTRVRVRR